MIHHAISSKLSAISRRVTSVFWIKRGMNKWYRFSWKVEELLESVQHQNQGLEFSPTVWQTLQQVLPEAGCFKSSFQWLETILMGNTGTDNTKKT